MEEITSNYNRYRIVLDPDEFKGIRCIQINQNGQLVVYYNEKNDKEEYDFFGTPDQAAREAARRSELYNREHKNKLGSIYIDMNLSKST